MGKKTDEIIRKEDKNALWLLWYFLKTGAVTFGSGGMLVVLSIKRDFAETYHWLTEEEVWDLYGVARSLPGLMITDVVCIFGYNFYGIPGAVAAILGVAAVPILCIIGVAYAYASFRSNYWIAGFMDGICAVVPPIMLTSMLSNAKTAFKKRVCYAIGAISAVLYVLGISGITITILDICLGLILNLIILHKKGKDGLRK